MLDGKLYYYVAKKLQFVLVKSIAHLDTLSVQKYFQMIHLKNIYKVKISLWKIGNEGTEPLILLCTYL